MDEEFEDNELLLVDLEWPSNPDPIEWDDPNFANEILRRINGIDEEGFLKEVTVWQRSLKLLPKYDEIAYRREIAKWNIGVPEKDNYDFDTHAMYYTLQMQYKNRIIEMIAIVNANHEMLTAACKTIQEMATALSKAKYKYDKDSNASFSVSQFTLQITHTKRLLSYLESVSKNIDFCAAQMDRLLREHQTLLRYNQNFVNEGMSTLLRRNSMPSLSNSFDSADIKTRNSRLK